MTDTLTTAMRVTRRRFGTIVGGALASFACGSAGAGADDANDGRLSARPRASAVTTATGGSHALGLERGRDAILQLPAKVGVTPLPLLVLLHGAGGSGEGVLRDRKSTRLNSSH